MNIRETFSAFSTTAANVLGSPWLFAVNVLLILTWLVSGPFFHFSDTWQLLVNTATTVITYLAVFLIQNTQNRDAMAVHLKLDELIASIQGARNRFVDLENVSDEELIKLEAQFQKLHERAKRGDVDAVEAVIEDIDEDIEDVETARKKKKTGSRKKK